MLFRRGRIAPDWKASRASGRTGQEVGIRFANTQFRYREGAWFLVDEWKPRSDGASFMAQKLGASAMQSFALRTCSSTIAAGAGIFEWAP